jgi:hypothetical protein
MVAPAQPFGCASRSAPPASTRRTMSAEEVLTPKKATTRKAPGWSTMPAPRLFGAAPPFATSSTFHPERSMGAAVGL